MEFLKKIVISILIGEARLALLRHKPRIIAVTGSVGKTTTKDAIHAALSPDLDVRKSEKSMNSEFGVPLTILGLENAWNDPIKWAINLLRGALIIFAKKYPAWLILEVGADRPGDISNIARWLRPDVAVITGVPEIPAHVEYFKSPEDIVREKKSLAQYLRPGGKLIVYGDDLRMRHVRSEFRGASLMYGLEKDNDYYASHEEIIYEEGVPAGIRFRINHDGYSLPTSVYGALGRPRVYASLAAIAVGECIGVDPVSSSRALTGWNPPPGRVRIIPGARGSIIIDDTYNSSPAAALAALDILKEVKAKRKIALMGDMLELGRYSKDAHRKVGERAADVADMLVTVGFRSRAMGEAALDAGMKDAQVREYELGESARAGEELLREIREGDVILVKGSQGIRMEKAVKVLMAEPGHAPEILVRQDEAWENR